MDSETLINLVLIFFFLVITMGIQVVKSMQKKKPGTPKKESKQSWFPLLQKLKDQFQEYIEDLERQARQAKQQKEAPDPTFWDELAEEDQTEDESASFSSEPKEPKQPVTSDTRKKQHEPAPVTPMPKAVGTWKTPAWIRQHPDLRQAVVWAEIIGKPVALKKGPPGPEF